MSDATADGASRSLRPRRSLKPPGWMTADMVGPAEVEKNIRRLSTRKRPSSMAPNAAKHEDLATKSEKYRDTAEVAAATSNASVREDTPPSTKSTRRTRERDSASTRLSSISTSPPRFDFSDLPEVCPIVTREMFQDAAKIALEIHNEQMAKHQRRRKLSRGGCLSRRASTINGNGGEVITASISNEKSDHAPTVVASTQVAGSIVLPNTNARRLLPTVIKVATRTPQRSIRVALGNYRQNSMRVLPPPHSPRQVLPLANAPQKSRIVVLKSTGSNGSAKHDSTAKLNSASNSTATALVRVADMISENLPIDDLLAVRHCSTKTPSPRGDRKSPALDDTLPLRSVKTEIPDEMPDNEPTTALMEECDPVLSITPPDATMDAETPDATMNAESLDDDDDTVMTTLAEPTLSKCQTSPVDGGIVTRLHNVKTERVRKGTRLSNGKVSYDLEQIRRDVKDCLAEGKFKLAPLANGQGMESAFFHRIIDEEGALRDFLQCKYCDGVFPIQSSSLHTDHLKTRHRELYKERFENERLECEAAMVPHEQKSPTRQLNADDLESFSTMEVVISTSVRKDSLSSIKRGAKDSVTTAESNGLYALPDSYYLIETTLQNKKIPPVANLFAFATFLQCRPTLLSLLVEHNLMRNSQWCVQCQAHMHTYSDPDSMDKIGWQCVGGIHRISIRMRSFFNGTPTKFRGSVDCPTARRMPLIKLLTFVYMWARECTDEQIATELTIAVFMAEQLSAKCRNICLEYCEIFSPKIGGENVIVEVDEMKIGASTFICAIDYRVAAAMFVRICPGQTVRDVIVDRIHTNSRIYIRERTSLLSLLGSAHKQYVFHTVPGHVECIGFVQRPVNARNFDARIMESIGNFWVNIREIYKLCDVNPAQCAPYISEMTLRQNAYALDEPVFNHFSQTLCKAQFQ